MNAPRIVMPLLLAAAIAAATASAEPPSPATPANAKLAQLQDRRSTGSFPRCTLGIELPDIPAFEAKAARVIVTKAVDDLGTNLVPEDAAGKTLEPTQRGEISKEGDGTVTIVFADMKNPPRKAVALKEVSGEIELYMPGRDPNGEASFPGFLSLAGKNLDHPALKANGIEISYLSAAQLAAERKKAEDAQLAALKEEGYTDEELIKDMVNSALGSFPKGEEGEIVLRVKDEGRAIQGIAMVDGEGNPAFAVKSEEGGLTTLSFWNDKPKPDWGMKVQMRTAASLVRQTFTFKDVPLP